MRKVGSEHADSTSTMSQLAFSTRIILGNIGASLRDDFEDHEVEYEAAQEEGDLVEASAAYIFMS